MSGAYHQMRRLALATTLLMTGCSGSGFYAFLGDTFQPPFGSNPNAAPGSSETYAKVRDKHVQAPSPILYEAGDVWPEPPKAPPTLKELQAQQNQDAANGVTSSPDTYTPLQPLPQLPGYDVPQQQISRLPPATSFPTGVVPLPGGGPGVITGGGGQVRSLNGPTGNGSIVVPNGNGTSTVIGPNGTVTTVPTQGK